MLAICGALFLPAVASAGSLPSVGSIEGKVTDASTALAIEGVEVCAYRAPEFKFSSCEDTDAEGEYTISGLPVGPYVVEFWGLNHGLGYQTQFFDNKSTPEDAAEVTVTIGGTVHHVDAEMHLGGTMAGRVTDATTNAAIEEALVCANGTVEFAGCAFTDATGEYALMGLATDSYEVAFWAAEFGYITQFYNGKTDPSQAETIAVVAPATVSGIDARLSKPVFSAPALPVPPAVYPPGPAQAMKKCRKGFKKTKKLGKVICKRMKKHHRKHKRG